MKKKTHDDDDGRVIASMNIDGMPWYVRGRRQEKPESASDLSDLTKEENRAIVLGAMKAGLTVGSVFFIVFLLFILFCFFVWFR